MDAREEGGTAGRGESWELAGTPHDCALFSFNSSFAHHVFRCRQKQFVLSVFLSLSSPLFLPQPLNHSPAGPSFAHAVSGCLFAWLCLRLFCVCVFVVYTHTCTRSSLRTLTNSQWKSVASLSVRTSGSGHFAVGSHCTLT